MEQCNNPCTDPTCRDADDHGVGLHCHHDHRDVLTKSIQDASVERSRHRQQAIEWLIDNRDKLKQLLAKNAE